MVASSDEMVDVVVAAAISGGWDLDEPVAGVVDREQIEVGALMWVEQPGDR